MVVITDRDADLDTAPSPVGDLLAIRVVAAATWRRITSTDGRQLPGKM